MNDQIVIDQKEPACRKNLTFQNASKNLGGL